MINLGYNQNSDQTIRLADGRRELLPSEMTNIPVTTPSAGADWCGYLKLDGTEVLWGSCANDERHYVCEYKGK